MWKGGSGRIIWEESKKPGWTFNSGYSFKGGIEWEALLVYALQWLQFLFFLSYTLGVDFLHNSTRETTKKSVCIIQFIREKKMEEYGIKKISKRNILKR